VDLVFADMMMPGLTDGFALAKWIGENQPEIPVIVASGNEGKAVAATEISANFQFVPKPYDLGELAARIRETLDQRPVAD
jgi:DNA-binding response OmpR family regulator